VSISKALKDEIIRSKKTRYAIAVGAGVDHAVLRRFLSGERDIKLHTAERLAGYLGLELRKRRK
jgi:hypothetical protein